MLNDAFISELKEHIDFELRCKKYSFLFEKAGYVQDVFDFSKKFIDYVKNKYWNFSEIYGKQIYVTESDFKSQIPYVERFTICFTINKSNEKNFNGAFHPAKSIMYVKNNSFFLAPYINITIDGNLRSDILEMMFTTIGHEMTHAHSDFKTVSHKLHPNDFGSFCLSGTPLSVWLNYIKNKQNEKVVDINYQMNRPANEFDELISFIRYKTLESERSAQIAQLRNELDNKPITDSNSAMKYIAKSDVYNNFIKDVQHGIDFILQYLFGNNDPYVKSCIVKSFNRCYHLNLNSPESVAKHLRRIKDDYVKYMMTRVGKIAQDIIEKNIMTSKITYPKKVMPNISDLVGSVLNRKLNN